MLLLGVAAPACKYILYKDKEEVESRRTMMTMTIYGCCLINGSCCLLLPKDAVYYTAAAASRE